MTELRSKLTEFDFASKFYINKLENIFTEQQAGNDVDVDPYALTKLSTDAKENVDDLLAADVDTITSFVKTAVSLMTKFEKLIVGKSVDDLEQHLKAYFTSRDTVALRQGLSLEPYRAAETAAAY